MHGISQAIVLEWVFISFATNDTYVVLYDADGNELAYDDYGSGDGYNNFKLVYELEAGKTYTVEVGFYSGSYAGDIPMLFGPVPTEE